jgi:hypothetical protein
MSVDTILHISFFYGTCSWVSVFVGLFCGFHVVVLYFHFHLGLHVLNCPYFVEEFLIHYFSVAKVNWFVVKDGE